MRKSSSLTLGLITFAFLIVALFSLQVTSAQPPRIPRPSKPKPTPTPVAEPATDTTAHPARPETRPATSPMGSAAAGEDRPTIRKDSLIIFAWKVPSYKGSFDTWSWLPRMRYKVNGPLHSGDQLYVEFSMPGAGPWVKFDCNTGEIEKDRWWDTECGGRDIPEEKSSTYTGPVNFAIKLRNELAGTDMTLFTGKAKVEKSLSNEYGPKAANHFVYFVNHDWNLPIGYVYLMANDLKGWNRPDFFVSFWVRGDAYNFQPHLFLNGKEVGKKSMEGQEVGRASCEYDIENNTTHYVADNIPQKAKWARVRCSF